MSTPQSMSPNRRHLILIKALAYAIRTIERRPSKWQEASDMQDMRDILEELVPDPHQRQDYLDGALTHMTGKPQGLRAVAVARMEDMLARRQQSGSA